MSDPGGPWRRDEASASPREATPRGRALPWILLFAGVIGLVLALWRAYPEAVQDGQDWAHVAYLLGFLLLLSAGAWRAREAGLSLGRHLRHAAAWLAIAAVLALGYAYREELSAVPRRLALAFNVGTPVRTAERELVIPQGEDGHYVVDGRVNGQRVRFMVDTGASDTVLSPADARRLGIDVDALRYGMFAETANGMGSGAAFTADRLEVGPVGFSDFDMIINKAPMSSSLLGLSFLSELESYEFRRRTLILKWREPAAKG